MDSTTITMLGSLAATAISGGFTLLSVRNKAAGDTVDTLAKRVTILENEIKSCEENGRRLAQENQKLVEHNYTLLFRLQGLGGKT